MALLKNIWIEEVSTMHEYLLERLDEEPDAVYCRGEEKNFWLPKSRCRIIQQDPPWRREKPDKIVILIPNDLAAKHGLQ